VQLLPLKGILHAKCSIHFIYHLIQTEIMEAAENLSLVTKWSKTAIVYVLGLMYYA